MRNYQKAICFLKRPHIAHRLREIYGRYSAIFSHHNLQKRLGQPRDSLMAAVWHRPSLVMMKTNQIDMEIARHRPGSGQVELHSMAPDISVCKLWSSDLRRYQQWSIPHRAAPRAGFESGSASPFQVVRLPNCLHSSGSNFIFHFSTSS